jgi:hypothetical protein
MDKIYRGIGKEQSIHVVISEGKIIQLDDGSIWEVYPGDIIKKMLWHETQKVIVLKNDNDIYPYRLKNLFTSDEEVVVARLISESKD